MLFDGVSHQLPDVDPVETSSGSTRSTTSWTSTAAPGPATSSCGSSSGPRQKQVDFPATVSDALRQHHPLRRGARVPRRRVPRAADPGVHPLERGGHGGPGQRPLRGHRRPPLHLRQLGRPLRGGLQPLLPRQGRRGSGRPGLLPGPRLAGHLRPGLRRGPAERGAARQLPLRGGRERTVVLPPPAPDARVLGVPDGVDGPRPAQRHRPGPCEPLPRTPAGSPTPRHSRVWGFVGDGELDEPETARRPGHGRTRAPRQPDLRRQLQPAAARRSGARATAR